MAFLGRQDLELPVTRVFKVAPYVILALLTGFTVLTERSTPGSLAIDLTLCGVAAVWMLWMITLHPSWRDRPAMMAIFIVGLIALMAVLVIRDPWFGFLSPAAYIYAFAVLDWPWELPAIAAVAAVAATAQVSSMPKNTVFGLVVYAGVLAANIGPMCWLAWLGHSGDEHNIRRDRAMTEVNDANRKLEAALAENAALQRQLIQGAREAGVLDERARLAREIHDTLAQGLTGIITQLQAAEHTDADPVARRRHVAAAMALARESLTEARRSVWELRPEPLEAARLGDALAGITERWSGQHDIVATVASVGEVRPISPDAELALLRAAQEALTNVAKHARATRVSLTLSYMAEEVALDVRDDGEGFDPSRRRRQRDENLGGFGLVAMRQRIEELAGTLHIESEPGIGTAVSACVPIAAGALR